MSEYDKFVEVAHRYLRMFCGMVFVAIGFLGAGTCVTAGVILSLRRWQPLPSESSTLVEVCAVVVAGYALALVLAGIVIMWTGARDIRVIKSLPTAAR